MYNINPYAQAGWYNPANPSSINERPGPTISAQPPTFGALPYPETPAPPAKRFVFTAQGRGIIQRCDVMDSETRLAAYQIQMAQDGFDYTSLQRPNGNRVGYIVWKPQGPEVELYGVVGKQKGKDWLPLSPDQRWAVPMGVAFQFDNLKCRSSRFMQFQGKHYTWQFARDAMYFYGYSLNRHQQLGKVYPEKDGTTVFEANDLLIGHGLLDGVILAVALLLSEKFRD